MSRTIQHIKEVDCVITDEENVFCDGGTPALGHPGVYLTFDANGKAVCPYCSRTFVFQNPLVSPQK